MSAGCTFTDLVRSAAAGVGREDLPQLFAEALRTLPLGVFPLEYGTQVWDRFLAEHAGMSLVAVFGPDGTVALVEELPAADAERFVAGRTDALIVLTWGEPR